MSIQILNSGAIDSLRKLPNGSVRCCVTSPPYWGLRDYGVQGQIGLERTPDEYVACIVDVFREVRRVLSDDGTLWLNLGDCYNAFNGGAGPGTGEIEKKSQRSAQRPQLPTGFGLRARGLKPKDLVGIPWLVAFALRADGWYLRSDIIWAKPNPMPESVTDRPTKGHEYIFLLSKSRRYYYDADAVAVTGSTIERLSQPNLEGQVGSARVPGKTNDNMKVVVKRSGNKARKLGLERGRPGSHLGGSIPWEGSTRNIRTVWNIPTTPYKEGHFATFPTELARRCILAGSALGDTVLDPFGGAGTTGLVADRLGRNAILIELNPEYCDMARRRINGDAPLFVEVTTAPIHPGMAHKERNEVTKGTENENHETR